MLGSLVTGVFSGRCVSASRASPLLTCWVWIACHSSLRYVTFGPDCGPTGSSVVPGGGLSGLDRCWTPSGSWVPSGAAAATAVVPSGAGAAAGSAGAGAGVVGSTGGTAGSAGASGSAWMDEASTTMVWSSGVAGASGAGACRAASITGASAGGASCTATSMISSCGAAGASAGGASAGAGASGAGASRAGASGAGAGASGSGASSGTASAFSTGASAGTAGAGAGAAGAGSFTTLRGVDRKGRDRTPATHPCPEWPARARRWRSADPWWPCWRPARTWCRRGPPRCRRRTADPP